MTTARKATAFVSAPDVSVGGQLLDRLVAFRPLREETIETKIGPSEATIAETIEINDDGTFVAHGEMPVFWQLVRRQLAHANKDQPWVAGRLTRNGAAYRLDPLNDTESKAVSDALDAYVRTS